MFENIKFSKEIKNNFLVKEYYKLKNEKYINKSSISYFKQNHFLKNYIFTDNKTNKIFTIEKDIKKDYNNYKNITIVKTLELERIRKNEVLIPIFITITLPSKYHPFKKINDIYYQNKNFEFVEIEQRITRGYKELNKIYREFYLNVKNTKKNKDIKFIKIIEPHKSLIPHLHRVVFVKLETKEKIEKQFFKVVKKYKLKKVKFETLEKGTSYVIKYITKNFNEEELKKLDGWKKLHKIRLFTMSNLPLTTEIFKKLYYNNKETNLKIIDKIKKGEIKYKNIYQYYTENTKIKKIYINENNEIVKINIKNKKRKNLFEFKQIIKVEEENKIIKKVKKINEDIKTIERLRNIYYTNKYEKFKEFYKITKKEKIFLINDYIYNIYIFKECIEFKKEKNYKTLNFRITNKKNKEILTEKNRFNKELFKQ